VEAFAVIRRSGTTVARRLLKRRLLISAIALVIPALAGCEAGLNAPTLEFHPATNGAYGSAGDITINNAFVLAGPVGIPVPSGGSAGLFVALYNGGTGGDRLLGAAAPGLAASVKVSGGTVALPVNTSVNLTGPAPDIVLSGLTRPISGGQAVPIVFDFQHAGAVTLMVPVEAHAFYYAPLTQPTTASPTPTASPSGKSASPSAKPSASPSR
jgi:copper(I)-binding protein